MTINVTVPPLDAFRPMDDNDFDAFAGAEDGSQICYAQDCAFIWNKTQPRIVHVIRTGADEEVIEFDMVIA